MLNTVKRKLVSAAALASCGVILYGVFLPCWQTFVWLDSDVWVALPSEYLLRQPSLTVKIDPTTDKLALIDEDEADAMRLVLSAVPSLEVSWPWLAKPHSWLGVHRIVTACLRFPISLLMVVIGLTCFIYSAVKLDQWTPARPSK